MTTPIPAGWKPISSAPEGVMILCANMNAMEARDWAFVAWMASGKVCGHRMDKPTHWMPLPAPPGSPASVAPGDAQDERQAFEEWFTRNDETKDMAARAVRRCATSGAYVLMQTYTAWEIWRAARASVAAPAAGDALDELTLAQKYEDACIVANANAQDAARWRFIRRKLCLTGNGDGTCAMHAINLPASIHGWPEPGPAVAEFCDAAIDAALAAQQGKGGKA